MALEQQKGVWKSGKGKGRHTPKGRQLQDDAWDDVHGGILPADKVVDARREEVNYMVKERSWRYKTYIRSN